MPKISNKMKNNPDEQFIIMQDIIEYYKQDSDEKMTKLSEEFKTMFAVLSNQVNTMSFSPAYKDTSTTTYLTTMVPSNRRAPPLEGVNSTKNGGMLTLKNDTRSPKFY